MAGRLITDIIEVNTIVANNVSMQDSSGGVYLSVSNGVLHIPTIVANNSVFFAGESRLFYTANSDFNYHVSNIGNPHNVTASQVGLGNVVNESKSVLFRDSSLTGNTVIENLRVIGSSNINAQYLDGNVGSYYLDYNNLSNKPTLTTSLSSLTDTNIINPVVGQSLIYNGTKWISSNSYITVTDYDLNPVSTQKLNIIGAGVNVINTNGEVTLDIPGNPPTDTVLVVGTEINSNYTITPFDNNKLIPVSGSVVITIPSGLVDSFCAIFIQTSTSTFTIDAGNGVILNSPQGTESQGEFSTIAIVQLFHDVYVSTLGGGGATKTIEEQLGDINTILSSI